MAQFGAILFDNGDTLFHKAPAPPAIASLAELLGQPIDEGAATAAWLAVKAHKRAITDESLIFGRNRSAAGHRDYYTTCYDPLEEIAPGLAGVFYERFKTDPMSMVPYPDTGRVLQALKENSLPVGIVSNTGWDIRAGYRRADLDKWVDTYVLSFEHGMAKPEQGLFDIACTKLEVHPREVLMVGNNGAADSGAAALGCTCLVLPPVGGGETRGLDAVLRLVGIDTPATFAAA